MPAEPEAAAGRLAAEAIAAGRPTAWFEQLYHSASRGAAEVPWDRGEPHPVLVEWVRRTGVLGNGRRAVVVGCGFGDDAELVASLGFATHAFDVAQTAIRTAHTRHPDTTVDYAVADLLELPADWGGGFDFVLESQTVQALPRSLRAQAIAAVRGLVAPGGRLLVLAGALGDDPPDVGPPWRLTRAELDAFGADGLAAVSTEQIPDASGAGWPRWRAEFVRA